MVCIRYATLVQPGLEPRVLHGFLHSATARPAFATCIPSMALLYYQAFRDVLSV